MTKIYTKTGDKGETSLFGGERLFKNHPRIRACGSIDEANSILGVAASFTASREIKNWIHDIQNDLFIIQAELAGAPKELDATKTQKLEGWIDELDAKLPPLKNFVLPGGTKTGALLHYARTVLRRAERNVTALAQKKNGVNPEIIRYVNRLSDLLFMMARWKNRNVREERPAY